MIFQPLLRGSRQLASNSSLGGDLHRAAAPFGAASRPIWEVAWRFFCSAALFISSTVKSPHTMPKTFAEPSLR
jgi:hypothetical protein